MTTRGGEPHGPARRSEDNEKMLSETMPILRREIVESQRSGADFLKWKLIATATVASIALGLRAHPVTGLEPQKGGPPVQLIICLIPLICAYVDMVSLDLAIRILAIGAFLRAHGDVYENWVQDERGSDENPFRFAPVAVHGSSFIVSFLILGVGLVGASLKWESFEVAAYVTSGLLGTAVTIVLSYLYYDRKKHLASTYPGSRRKRNHGK